MGTSGPWNVLTLALSLKKDGENQVPWTRRTCRTSPYRRALFRSVVPDMSLSSPDIIPATRGRIHVEASAFRLLVCGSGGPDPARIARRPVADGGSGRPGVRGTALPVHWTRDDVRPHFGPGCVRSESGDLLRRHRSQRRLEDGQQRRDVRGAVPGHRADFDWRRHGLAEGSEPGLGRRRRVEQPADDVVGRRRLQVD